VFGQFTTSSVAFETPIIQLIRNSETLKSLSERSDEASFGNKTSKGNLLYRATRDGFTSKAFHSKCDGKGNTITIIKNNLNYTKHFKKFLFTNN
jgi:hypothetical protein